MIKLLKVKSSFKTKNGQLKFKFENSKQEFENLKQEFQVRMKNGDYVFCNIKQDKIKGLSWGLYQDNEGNNIYSLYENWIKRKNSSCHYGLKIDKLTNIFNVRKEVEKGEVEVGIHENINEYLKENKKLYEDIDFEAKVIDRLIVGLGGHSVFETDIKIHHTYGVPYIPGSSVKGCFRSHIIKKYFSCNEKEAENDKHFIEMFGGKYKDKNKNYKGLIIFMDVFPRGEFKIKRDIMTPHYQHGYTDDGVITPIEMLVVEDTSFRFVLRINKKCFSKDDNSNIQIQEGKSVKEFITSELFEMTSYHGIGAKTSVGYGYFQTTKR